MGSGEWARGTLGTTVIEPEAHRQYTCCTLQPSVQCSVLAKIDCKPCFTKKGLALVMDQPFSV